jgi:hypothetical protein
LCSTPGERIVVSVTSFVTSGRVEKSAWQPWDTRGCWDVGKSQHRLLEVLNLHMLSIMN